MAQRTRLPGANFETGIEIRRMVPGMYASIREFRAHHEWHIVGRLEDSTPFLLFYSGSGITNWNCATTLGFPLRKKILGHLREQVRYVDTPPEFLTVHDLTAKEFEAASVEAGTLALAFFKDVWRAQYLNDRDEDYIDLKVPFSEKDQAKALGAVWEPNTRTWRVKRRDDMTAFAQWLPKD